jgi:GT2 family glycosyltransferase
MAVRQAETASKTQTASKTETAREADGVSEATAASEMTTASEPATEATSGPAAQTLTVSCVILTMGDRPAEVNRAIDSVLAQRGIATELVVVGNGADVTGVPAGVRTVRLPENLGVAGGRNAGVQACTGDVVLFLDDDGWYPDPGLASYIAARFAAGPALAVLSMQVVDPEGGPGARWHVPRLRAGDPGRSSVVTTFLGGACAIRRTAYLEAGGLPDAFFYAHEETDLAWRLMDRGYRLEYDGAARMCHHSMPNARHATFRRRDGKNRVLLARRNLPWPLAAVYLADWMALTVVRERSPENLRPWFAGFAEGWRADPGRRRPISLRTAWRMTRAGRPPVI